MLRTFLVSAAFLTLLMAFGCTEGAGLGESVGNSCSDDRDCARGSFCLREGRYPDGFCTQDCRDDRDCPTYARCVEDEGGVCLLECDGDRDCPARYECDSRDREGSPGRTEVCRGD